MVNFGGEEGIGYSEMSSGFQIGEPSSRGAIRAAGIGGNMDALARNASTVSLVLALAISILLRSTSGSVDGHETADQILCSSSVITLVGSFFGD